VLFTDLKCSQLGWGAPNLLIYIKAAGRDARGDALGSTGRNAMIRWTVVAVTLALVSSVQAMPLVPLQMPDDVVSKVREACGAGMHMVNGVCVRTAARRGASRCARGVTC
jgi:hypothetical protein